MDRLVRRALVSILVLSAGCGAAPPTAPAPESAAITASSLTIAGLDGGAAVVGVTVALHADIVLSDRRHRLATAGPAWSSSDESIARVDQEGRVTGVSPGLAILESTVKGASGRLEVPVVMNVAGTWTFHYLGDPCLGFQWGCPRFDPPGPRTSSITFSQIGAQLTAADPGLPSLYLRPASGTVDVDGTIRLSAHDCYDGDWYTGPETVVDEWEMSARGAGSGRARWSQRRSCGTGAFETVVAVSIFDFTRAS